MRSLVATNDIEVAITKVDEPLKSNQDASDHEDDGIRVTDGGEISVDRFNDDSLEQYEEEVNLDSSDSSDNGGVTNISSLEDQTTYSGYISDKIEGIRRKYVPRVRAAMGRKWVVRMREMLAQIVVVILVSVVIKRIEET